MKPATARATSKPGTRTTTNAASRDRALHVKNSTMSPEPSSSPPTITTTTTTTSAPRRSSAVPIRQSLTRPTSSAGSRRASPQRRSSALSPPPASSSPRDGNSPSNGSGTSRPTSTTRRQSSPVTPPSTTVKGFISPQQKKPLLSHEFLNKTTNSKSRGGPSTLTRSIDDVTTTSHQLRRHSAPPSKVQDYLSRSHDHGSLASFRSTDRGPKSLSSSQDRGPRSLTSSLNKGPMNLSKSQDRGSLSGYASHAGGRKLTVPAYGFDGRRLSTGSREVVPHAYRMSDIKAHYQGVQSRRDGASLQLQMGRSVDSTVSLSTAASSRRQSLNRDSSSRLSPLQLSDPIVSSQGYRSGELTPDEASPLDGRAPASGLRTRPHRQLKSPDFFDVKQVGGEVGGVITAVSRMHYNGVGQPMGGVLEREDLDTHKQQSASERTYSGQSRRDSLTGSARKAFSAESDSAIGSSHFSEINYKLDKELSSAQELLEIGSWNEDDDEYLRIYKGERSAEGSFVDILEDTTSDSGRVAASNLSTTSTSPSRAKKKWADFSKVSESGQFHGPYDNALYEKSEPESELGTSTQPSPQASPPRGSPAASATKAAAAAAAAAAAVSRISSTSATSIDLNRSTDTTCSTHSQYDNAFWGDPPMTGTTTFRPWNPKREAEMTPVVAPTSKVELTRPQESSVVRCEPAGDVAALKDSSRGMTYNDGLERLTSYMKTASQTALKKNVLSDELSSSQASGCFDYLVDFLESQQSITDVLVSAHDEAVKHDLAHAAAAAGNMTPKRLDASKLTTETAMLSNRSIESRITDLGSEASWESGKSRSVQTLGTTGKVMDQITEKVDSLSFDSPKHLSTFKFGLKKTTVGAFETITSSDQVPPAPESSSSLSAPPSRPVSERSFPQQRKPHLSGPQSPNSWRSQTAPSSQGPSRNPSRTPSKRIHSSDEKNGPSPLSTSTRQIKIVSERGVESGREDDVVTPSMSDKPVVTELLPRKESPRKASPRKAARQQQQQQGKKSSGEKKKVVDVEKKTVKAEPEAMMPASPIVNQEEEKEEPVKDVQMHVIRDDDDGASEVVVVSKGIGRSVRPVDSASMKSKAPSDRSLVKHDRDSLSLDVYQANKGGCGCNIL